MLRMVSNIDGRDLGAVLLMGVVSVLGLSGCDDESASEPATVSSNESSSMTVEEKFERVLAMNGWSLSQAIPDPRGMVVGGDILIRTTELDGHLKAASQREKAYLCNGSVGADEETCDLTATDVIDSVNSISMTFDANLSAAWTLAFRRAASIWSTSHFDGQPIAISIDTEGKRSSRWNIHVAEVEMENAGLASWPSISPIGGGHVAMNPGTLIEVNDDEDGWEQAFLDKVALHEIGHSIAFHHPKDGPHLAGTSTWAAAESSACTNIGDAGTYPTIMCTGSGYPSPFLSEDDLEASHILYPSNRVFDMTAWSSSFCTTDNPCDVGEGDCDSDDECKGFLICDETSRAVNLYGAPSGWDVCTPPLTARNDGSVACSEASTSTRCQSVDCPCGAGMGDCDSDMECGGGMLCGTDNGPAVGSSGSTDVCVHARPPGCARMDRSDIDSELCTTDCPCSFGEGDCDVDNDCIGSLVCAQNVGASFGLASSLDLCVAANQVANL